MSNEVLDQIKLDTIEEAIQDIKDGKIIIVVDDEDRENEGDFICAAEKVTPEIINFMSKYGRGLICTPISAQRASELKLNNMVDENTDLHGTAFTVSIDYRKEGCTTGISAYDRATGIHAITRSETKPEDYARPGHIFPLIAKQGGVLRRTGHTEAAVDLAELAGLNPSGVLVEILNEDGTMARLPELKVIAEAMDMKLISIKDLVAYRMKKERLILKEEEFEIETAFGKFNLITFSEKNNELNHLVFKKGEWSEDEDVLCRVHSSCNANELLSFMINAKDHEFSKTLKAIDDHGKGVLIMLRKEEDNESMNRAIQLLKAQVSSQEEVDLFPRDINAKHRELGIGAQILREMGVRNIKLLSNSSSRKRVGLIGYGLKIVEHIEI